MTIEVDVLIVGARVAGSILATFLGQDGWQVLVIDRATFPSSTLSTHFFRGSGCASVLERVGVLNDALALGAPRLVREYNADAIDGTSTVDPPQDPGDVGFNLSVRREPLDAMLVEQARRQPTVRIEEETNFVGLIYDGDRVVGAEISDASGSREVRARFVIGADGHATRVGRLAAEVQEEVPPARAMYYRYANRFEGPHGDPDGPEFSLADDELAYVFPSDGGTACIAISVNLADYAHIRTDAERAFGARLAAHPFLAERVQRAEWSGRLWACGPRPSVVRVPAGPGWALVGDASMFQDPWTGLGMDNASIHATFLAEAIDNVLSGRTPETSALASYHQRRDAHALKGFRETADLGRDLNSFRQS